MAMLLASRPRGRTITMSLIPRLVLSTKDRVSGCGQFDALY